MRTPPLPIAHRYNGLRLPDERGVLCFGFVKAALVGGMLCAQCADVADRKRVRLFGCIGMSDDGTDLFAPASSSQRTLFDALDLEWWAWRVANLNGVYVRAQVLTELALNGQLYCALKIDDSIAQIDGMPHSSSTREYRSYADSFEHRVHESKRNGLKCAPTRTMSAASALHIRPRCV